MGRLLRDLQQRASAFVAYGDQCPRSFYRGLQLGWQGSRYDAWSRSLVSRRASNGVPMCKYRSSAGGRTQDARVRFIRSLFFTSSGVQLRIGASLQVRSGPCVSDGRRLALGVLKVRVCRVCVRVLYGLERRCVQGSRTLVYTLLYSRVSVTVRRRDAMVRSASQAERRLREVSGTM